MYLSIITLNVNSLNLPIKRHRLAGCIKDPTIFCLLEMHLTDKEKHRFIVKTSNILNKLPHDAPQTHRKARTSQTPN
jgi:exonuclease III